MFRGMFFNTFQNVGIIYGSSRGWFVCLFVCLSVCLSSYVRASFFQISGVVPEHFCSWAGLFFQDNFCHGLVTGQSVTEIILKNQLRPRAEMFRNDPRNMIKMTPEHAKTDRQTERQTDRQTNKQTHKQTNPEMIHK